MKHLSPKILKALIILLSLCNAVLAYYSYALGSDYVSILYNFLFLQLLIGLLYIVYVACVVWINESQSRIQYRIDKIDRDSLDNRNRLESKLQDFRNVQLGRIEKLDNRALLIEKSSNEITKRLLGQDEMLYVLSQENDVLKSKLLALDGLDKEIIEQINQLSTNSQNAFNKTDGAISTLSEKSESLRKELGESIASTNTNVSQTSEEVKQVVKQVVTQENNKLIVESNAVRDGLHESLRAINEEIGKGVVHTSEIVKEESEQVKNNIKAKSDQVLNDIKLKHESVIDNVSRLSTILSKDNSDIKKNVYFNYNRIDALFSIHQLINLRSPLPIMHDWAISSDYAHLLLRTALTIKGGNILDVGSGISTLLLAYAVERLGVGKVISLEHDKDYLEKTRELVAEHGLEQYVSLNYCPLIEYSIKGETWKWYDISKVKTISNLALVSVDGPPGNTQKMSRYPAIPLVKEALNADAIILLDDGARADETEIANRWAAEFELNSEFVAGFKGVYKFNKQ